MILLKNGYMKMKNRVMIKEIRRFLGIKLIGWALRMLPDEKFKAAFAVFIVSHINDV